MIGVAKRGQGAMQARNQLGTPAGRAKSFFERGPNLLTLSYSFKLCPTHFSRGEIFCRRTKLPLQLPWLRNWDHDPKF